MATNYEYNGFLNTLSKKQWSRLGTKRRSGVAVPLFSIHSSGSIGIGDFYDLMPLVDWCKEAGMSIIQLLPANDVGFSFRPYDAQSTFALDPMYLALNSLKGVKIERFKSDIQKIKDSYPTGKKRVNYGVKGDKLALLWKIFDSGEYETDSSFNEFIAKNSFWIKDYCLFKVIKEKNNEMAWEGWSEDLKHRRPDTLFSFCETYAENLLFHQWLQWQLYEQFKAAKSYAGKNGVFIMGDLPFLVSRDSADVWANQEYFKLNLASGAPPDMLFAKGQRWGMPPYNWRNIEKNGFDYLTEKLKYAQNFYDLYRIDHVVGVFRVWTIPLSEPLEHAGSIGSFDPKEESNWEQHGRKLLSVMIENTDMLACAEDLGTVPACSYSVLKEFGIPGIDIQRWSRDWDKTYEFIKPEKYRKNSISTISTHDITGLCSWWNFEAGTIDEELFKRKCAEKHLNFDELKNSLFDVDNSFHGRLRWKKEVNNEKTLLERLKLSENEAKEIVSFYRGSFDEKEKFLSFVKAGQKNLSSCQPELIENSIKRTSETSSIFAIQLITDWLSLEPSFNTEPWETRINFPGTLNEKNWTLVLPVSLEEMLKIPINKTIKKINTESSRI